MHKLPCETETGCLSNSYDAKLAFTNSFEAECEVSSQGYDQPFFSSRAVLSIPASLPPEQRARRH